MNDRETAMLLAALRHWQQDGLFARRDHPMREGTNFREVFGDHEPLSDDEIDALCEKLNHDPTAPVEAQDVKDLMYAVDASFESPAERFAWYMSTPGGAAIRKMRERMSIPTMNADGAVAMTVIGLFDSGGGEFVEHVMATDVMDAIRKACEMDPDRFDSEIIDVSWGHSRSVDPDFRFGYVCDLPDIVDTRCDHTEEDERLGLCDHKPVCQHTEDEKLMPAECHEQVKQ